MTLRVLDLFCGAGGASYGYGRAGFHVTGVDIVDRPTYAGDVFVKADALQILTGNCPRAGRLSAYDLIHWSPPCQKANTLTIGTNASRGWGGGDAHRQYIPELRPLIEATGLPYVLEQPVGNAPMRRDLMLCMDMFPVGDPPWVQRHRYFEINGFTVPQPVHPKHQGYVRGMRHGVVRQGPYVAAYGSGGGKATVPEMQHALGIDWTNDRSELTEAIPPAYAEWIGKAFRL